MSIDNTLGLLDFSDFLIKELDSILADDKISWRDIPKFILILFKIKLLIAGVKHLPEEIMAATDQEMEALVLRLQGTTQKLANLIMKHQNDVVQTSSINGMVDMSGFSEEEFKNLLTQGS